ncbi:hypothetical protein [Comamonas sp. C11]|uniref:hypothetical protein n=1 Tax=Comamonas sp. C11 TaxID=2966554 RepID=UPI0021126B5B|nr:hypothetical protein [Comamonas sp. C11]UUC95460.1 hypothetical protein NOX35_09285 [Comamonas sp. C11]
MTYLERVTEQNAEELFKRVQRLPELEGQSSHGGGDGYNGSMEARVKALEEAVKNLPTKADFAELRADVKTGISDLRAEMHKTNIDIHKWMIGTVIGLFLGFGGLFLAMSNALKQSSPASTSAIAQPTTPPPIIINVPGAAPAATPSTAPQQ